MTHATQIAAPTSIVRQNLRPSFGAIAAAPISFLVAWNRAYVQHRKFRILQ